LRCDRIDAPCIIDGPINGLSFRAYVEQFLVPTLTAGDIVIMDNLGSHNNLGSHKRETIRRLIRAAGAKLFFCRPTHPTSTDRAGLRQAQDPAAQSRRANERGHLETDRRPARPLHTAGMRQLPRQRWLCFGLKGSRSSL